MRKGWSVEVPAVLALLFLALNCMKSSSPMQPALGPQLDAIPASVIVHVGTSQTVTISGGTPPYGIETPPGPIATALLTNADSASASIQITGVTVASVSTAVVIKDSSAVTKTVDIPIRVQ